MFGPASGVELMATDTFARDKRIELRATQEELDVLAAAAASESRDVASFILDAAVPAARAVMEGERIVLSERDTARVLALLENPPEPTKALIDAMRLR
jgi:uncharacterized protein (DUF1778 family)